jgi:hypothetical protein
MRHICAIVNPGCATDATEVAHLPGLRKYPDRLLSPVIFYGAKSGSRILLS